MPWKPTVSPWATRGPQSHRGTTSSEFTFTLNPPAGVKLSHPASPTSSSSPPAPCSPPFWPPQTHLASQSTFSLNEGRGEASGALVVAPQPLHLASPENHKDLGQQHCHDVSTLTGMTQRKNQPWAAMVNSNSKIVQFIDLSVEGSVLLEVTCQPGWGCQSAASYLFFCLSFLLPKPKHPWIFIQTHKFSHCGATLPHSDLCSDLPELEIVSLLSEGQPNYTLRADSVFGYDNDDWLHTPLLPPEVVLGLTHEQIEETLKYFCE